ncbi:MAG: hypothetical protein IPN67_01190 [Bacteroidales bacterium]|nr:hypothetical protein [Bacteroidales bacterium]
MKRFMLIISYFFIFFFTGSGQVKKNTDESILFRGLVIDANTFSPVTNTQIMINNSFSSTSGVDGSFSFYVKKSDTVIFRSLGYKESVMSISDTLGGREYLTGIYLNSDTISIGEVIIVPGYKNLKSEILNAKTSAPPEMDNARYNVAVSAYQGKNSMNKLGDPQDNYAVINQRHKIDAYEKGGIPSEFIAGFNALIFLPVAYSLLRGLPESPPPMQPQLSEQETARIHKKYLETQRQKK